MTINDPALLEPKSGSAKPTRRDAVGAEIPVTVHASRTTQGLGKNLPSVHEDTKTVIVLQQGAVVRLTATLASGETVVLTNRMTGADVLCRVGNVKSQPGIQHYVDLEFIQRAPGFWGDAVAASSATMVSQAPAASPTVPAVAVPIATPAAALPLSPAPLPAPVAVAAPPPVPIAVAPPPPIRVAPPPAPAPVVDLPPVAIAEQLQPAPLAEPVAASWNVPQTSSSTALRSSVDDSSFGSIGAESLSGRSSGSSKALLAVAAAVLLVLGGAGGGYWVYSRQNGAVSSPASQQAANIPAAHATPESSSVSAPIPNPAPAVVSAALPAPQTDIVIESRPTPAADALAARVQPPVAAARIPLVRHNVPVEQLKAPKAKTAAARMDSNAAPPAMMDTLSLGDTGAGASLLVGDSAGPAPPPGSSGPVVGGQLQPPQLLSSTAAVYPQSAKMQRIQGVVALDVLVDETGKVVETTPILGPQSLIPAAEEAVRNWKYKPAQLNGKPISVHTRVSIRFNLQ